MLYTNKVIKSRVSLICPEKQVIHDKQIMMDIFTTQVRIGNSQGNVVSHYDKN